MRAYERGEPRTRLVFATMAELHANLLRARTEAGLADLLAAIYNSLTVATGPALKIIKAGSGELREVKIVGIDSQSFFPLSQTADLNRYIVIPNELHLADGCEARLIPASPKNNLI